VKTQHVYTFTFDWPVSADEADAVLGPGARRLLDLAVVDELIENGLNRNAIRAAVARAIGYDDLADYLSALADDSQQRGERDHADLDK
jgi:hypothetical protein